MFYVDIPENLDELLAWIYLTAKKGAFPVTLLLLGEKTTFDSTAQMIGFAVGVKRTSDVLKVASPAQGVIFS